MRRRSSSTIRISRRALALALVGAAALGVGAGELAAPPAAGQAAAPTACHAFADDVATTLKGLGTVVGVESRYAAFIPKAYKDGENRDVAGYRAIGKQLAALVKQVQKQDSRVSQVLASLAGTEKACLAG